MSSPLRARPFALRVNAGGRPHVIQASVEFTGRLTPEHAKLLRLVIDEFAAFARSGALGGNTVDPSGTSLVAATPEIYDCRFDQRFEQVHQDWTAVTCLINFFEWFHHQVTPLRSLEIQWKDIPDSAWSRLPQRWPRIGFPCQIDDLERRFTMEARFTSPPSEQTTAEILTLLGAWYIGVNRGAYAAGSIVPSECHVYLGDDGVDVTPEGMVWFFDSLHASDAALDGLVNALEKVHQTLAPLSRVHLSP